MATTDPRSHEWHLDRKVPLTIIFALVTQIVYGIVQFNDMRTRVDALEHTRADAMAGQKDRDDRQDRDIAAATTRMQDQLEKINDKLDRLIESRPHP